MAYRIPIENEEERNDEEGPSVAPSREKVRKAYVGEELPSVDEAPEEPQEKEESPEERYLRLAAEFDNYKKRMERERALSLAYANEGLIEKLLPVVDNLERALDAAEPGGGQDGLVSGVELTLKALLKVLRREGVEPIEAQGKPFDPNIHEAISTLPSDEVPEGRVVNQVEKGYLYRDRVLRPAKVVVSSGPPKAAAR